MGVKINIIILAVVVGAVSGAVTYSLVLQVHEQEMPQPQENAPSQFPERLVSPSLRAFGHPSAAGSVH